MACYLCFSWIRLGLPGNVGTSDPKAAYEDGVLKITLDKVEESKRHSVKIH